jgi:predicted DsbA family dithiol-disulfide isomerase
MKVDIWSDIMCPFCYIGKRNFEAALEQFPHRDKLDVVWHSFQLDPTMKSQPGKDVYEYLAERKGQSREWSVKMHEHVVQTAREAGLTYNFDKAVIANSFDAHRLIQLAKKHGAGDAAEERLFRAYFTEGEDVASHDTLVRIGSDIGLDTAEVQAMLQGDDYTEEVHRDIARADALGIRGVPFFVFNNRFAVSGAQPVGTFVQALQQAWAEYEKEHPAIVDMSSPEGSVCSVDGVCEPAPKSESAA